MRNIAAFKALNLESDSESDDEVDNTKEIQIEEALKLYQNALKLHSEGPASRDETRKAYHELFRSEIFQYLESLSEWERSARSGDQEDFEYAAEDAEAGPAQLNTTGDSAPNTLPQIIHLASKNSGQFMIDDLVEKHETFMRHIEETGETFELEVRGPQLISAFKLPLQHYSDALDKDDTDLELWTRAAAIAEAAGSERLARYCLEAVLDGDDEGIDSLMRAPGLHETKALELLRKLLLSLEDDLSSMQEPIISATRRSLPQALRKRLITQTYPGLSDIARKYKEQILSRTLSGAQPERLHLTSAKADWALVGDALLQHIVAEKTFANSAAAPVTHGPGAGVQIQLSDTMLPTQTLQLTAQAETPQQVQESAEVTAVADPDPGAVTDQVAQAAADDVQMQDGANDAMEAAIKPEESAPPDAAPSRKRSTDSAGLPETAEGGRGRSKRLRARETLPEGDQVADLASVELAKQMTNQLWNYEQADHYLFTIAGDLYGRLGAENLGTSASLRQMLSSPSTSPLSSTGDTVDLPAKDLFYVLQNCTPKMVNLLSFGDSIDQMGGLSREAGLNAFLGTSKRAQTATSPKPALDRAAGLSQWISNVNNGWKSLSQAALEWISCLLRPGRFPDSSISNPSATSTYKSHKWPEDLKRVVVQMIVNLDENLYDTLSMELTELDASIVSSADSDHMFEPASMHSSLIEYIQTLFELHLDIYSLIKHPESRVIEVTQVLQHDRLERWALLARDAINLRRNWSDALDELTLRHLWASAFHVSISEEVSQSHVVACIEDVKQMLAETDAPVIYLQNNAIMPEVSVVAADRALSEINVKDLFLRVFDHDEKDPVAVIESLEPILDPTATGPKDDEDPEQDAPLALNGADEDASDTAEAVTPTSPYTAMRKFLETASVSLRLSLWQRLREAYEAIDYTPKVVSCYLRSIELIASSLKASSYGSSAEEMRHATLLEGIRIVDEIILKILAMLKSCDDPWAYLDDAHLTDSMSAMADFLRLLTTLNVYEDQLRVGKLPPPMVAGRPNNSFPIMSGRLHDVYVRAWVLHYLLLKEGMSQNPEQFPSTDDEKLDLLRHIHYATGIRGYGHASNRVLLKLLKDELLGFEKVDSDTRDAELCQTLYDLYGLKFFSKAEDVMEYAAPPDNPDRKTASQLLSFVMAQAHKIPLKDLHKHDLKSSVDKLHGALGKPKANEDMATNRVILNAFLKSPIRPTDLYRCLQGIGTLSSKSIQPARAIAASKGWYFLMGIIALHKFRSQKKAQGNPTEELHFAAAFFMQDLEYSIERWETWYRLAQTYDSLLEDAVSWNAEKLNTNSHEVLQYQRSAIHCYIMAVCCSVRNPDLTGNDDEMVAELYADFGMLMYSSTREPFSMHAFGIRETEERHYSKASVQPGPPFVPLNSYIAWKFASNLFKRAINLTNRNDRWLDHYMLAKCLWKMRRNRDAGHANLPGPQNIIASLTNAIEASPEKKGRDPILEPHHKLISIVDKLVKDHEISIESACETLQATPYARKYGKSHDADDWEQYVLTLLKELRNADKSNWHHRIAARYAHVIYDGDASSNIVAQAAKDELMKQIFTKTMAINIWKPEMERPGRHFVYTTRYTRFFLRLLIQLDDRASLEALTKRVRRKPHDFFEHTKLWQEICLAYLKMLRRAGDIPEGHEDAIFKSLALDDFSAIANRLEAWMQAPTTSSPVLDVLREEVELKRTNNSLMKSLLIDDLIGDTYAWLYDRIGRTLPPLPSEAAVEAAKAAAAATNNPFITNGALQAADRPSMMSLTSLIHTDGAFDRPSLPSTSILPSSEAPAPKKPKNVGRREIAKRSEAATVRPAPAPLRLPATPMGNQTVEVVIRSPSVRKKSFGAASVMDADGNLTVPGSKDDGPSAPGSVHDEADDESELSEPGDYDDDEEEQREQEVKKRKPLFPNLVRAQVESREEGAESSVASPEAVTADEGGEEDEDEKGGNGDEGEGEGEGDEAGDEADEGEGEGIEGEEEAGDKEQQEEDEGEEEVFEEAAEEHDAAPDADVEMNDDTAEEPAAAKTA